MHYGKHAYILYQNTGASLVDVVSVMVEEIRMCSTGPGKTTRFDMATTAIPYANAGAWSWDAPQWPVESQRFIILPNETTQLLIKWFLRKDQSYPVCFLWRICDTGHKL